MRLPSSTMDATPPQPSSTKTASASIDGRPNGDGCWIVDLHCHTYGRSVDSWLSVEDLLSDAAGRGVRSVCVTDHDAFWPEDVVLRAKAANCSVLPGSEVNTDDGHVLVFGLHAYWFGFHHSGALAKAVRAVDGAMVLAHPYRRALLPDVAPNSTAYDRALRRALDNPILRLVDAIEVVNGRGTTSENRFSSDLARLAGLPGTGGSDAHLKNEAGTVATAFRNRVESVADLVRALKSRRFAPIRLPGSASAGEPGRK